MAFQDWLNLQETTLPDLYASTVKAFPQTQKRQYSTNLVKITELTWRPYLGVKTLFVKGLAQSGESGKEYNPIVVFKGVSYHPTNATGLVELRATDGQTYFLEKLSYEDTDVLLRCNCKDFIYRFRFYDSQDHSLYGTKGKKYEGQGLWKANPQELPGMCKHLMKTVQAIGQSGLIR